MPISWNEIRHNAVRFSKEWASGSREGAEAKSFWDEFFGVFGIRRRTVASFEEPVKKLSGGQGFIDLFWPGTLLVEHKSRGKSLDKAESQAMSYIRALKDAGRDDEIPRYVIVSDFARIALHDLDENTSCQIDLVDLHSHVDKFAFIPGYEQHTLDGEDPVNIQAVELLGELHDALEAGGYAGHDLERFLVRILFCLFAEDTGLIERSGFTHYIQDHTTEDGSDLGVHLAKMFQVLNTPRQQRQKNLLEELKELPYVNGDLFAESLGFADLNRDMRNRLMACCRFDWSRISPAVFGSLFQCVMEPRERRQIGAHYTSERDILKVVRSLFLDDLRAELAAAGTNKRKLKELHGKLGKMRFLDPACGCGNFLVVTYRELRLLELELLAKLFDRQKVIDIHDLSVVDVDAMYGIEINEFPARIAEVALWLVDHQMNLRLSTTFGQYFVRLPLKKSAKIVCANALRVDWNEVLPAADCGYVLGNPPFVGAKYQTDEQRADMKHVAGSVNNYGLLDFVTAWYFKAAHYIAGTNCSVSYVSTNSITQGEQVGVLWSELLRLGIRIRFAHRTFSWQSEARGRAHVHVVIIGFAAADVSGRRIYDYENDELNPTVTSAKRISPYLVEGPDTIVMKRSKPLCSAPALSFGSMPNDDGHLLLTDEEKSQLLRDEPQAAKFIRQILGSTEFINGVPRWCLWLVDATPQELHELPLVLERVERVRLARLRSKRETTNRLASVPALFGEIRQPRSRYLGIPKTSSERRQYVPMGFLPPTTIAGSELFTCPDATLFHFGVLSSRMHVAWISQVAGRMKSDYRYSARLVYNNFPWPTSMTPRKQKAVEVKAQAVLDVRASFPTSSLADLYDPLTMPVALVKAHVSLDRAVEACYRAKRFESDRERVEYLLRIYEQLTAPISAANGGAKSRP